MRIKVINNPAFLKAQWEDAFNSPLNLYATRTALSKSNPTRNELLLHYINNGGAKYFAEKRRFFAEEVELCLDDFNIDFEI